MDVGATEPDTDPVGVSEPVPVGTPVVEMAVDPVGAVVPDKPNGDVPVGVGAADESPNGEVPEGEAEEPNGDVPVEAVDVESPKGDVPVGATDDEEPPKEEVPVADGREAESPKGAEVPVRAEELWSELEAPEPKPKVVESWRFMGTSRVTLLRYLGAGAAMDEEIEARIRAVFKNVYMMAEC